MTLHPSFVWVFERVGALARVGLVLLGVFTVLTFFAPVSDFGDILTSFHHLFAGAGLVAMLFFAFHPQPRQRPFAAAAALATFINALPLVSLVGTENQCGGSVTAVTLNALGPDLDVDGGMRWIESVNPDVLGVTELGGAFDQRLREVYPFAYSLPDEGTAGMGLFSKTPLKDQVVANGAWFPQLFATTVVDGRKVRVGVVHPPPPFRKESSTLRNDEIRSISRIVERDGLPTILLGDLNVTRDSPNFEPLIRAGLTDTRAGQGVLGSWPASSPFRVGIDHVLVDDSFAVCDVDTGPRVGSDHLPIIAILRFRSE